LTSGEVRDVVVLDTKEKITRAGLDSSNAKLWPAMTTVVAMYGATAGQVCLIAQEMTANQACCALIPKAEFRTFVFIAARQSVQQLSEKASGSAQQNLNKSLVESHAHVIPIREVAEQFEMATAGLLQQWILNQRETATLSELRDSLLPKLLSGELSVTEAMAEAQA
jgi:type I restriction enzyme S subunit